MSYIKREIERKFLEINAFFKAVLVTGARQVGKTTMLKHLAEGTRRTYVLIIIKRLIWQVMKKEQADTSQKVSACSSFCLVFQKGYLLRIS